MKKLLISIIILSCIISNLDFSMNSEISHIDYKLRDEVFNQLKLDNLPIYEASKFLNLFNDPEIFQGGQLNSSLDDQFNNSNFTSSELNCQYNQSSDKEVTIEMYSNQMKEAISNKLSQQKQSFIYDSDDLDMTHTIYDVDPDVFPELKQMINNYQDKVSMEREDERSSYEHYGGKRQYKYLDWTKARETYLNEFMIKIYNYMFKEKGNIEELITKADFLLKQEFNLSIGSEIMQREQSRSIRIIEEDIHRAIDNNILNTLTQKLFLQLILQKQNQFCQSKVHLAEKDTGSIINSFLSPIAMRVDVEDAMFIKYNILIGNLWMFVFFCLPFYYLFIYYDKIKNSTFKDRYKLLKDWIFLLIFPIFGGILFYQTNDLAEHIFKVKEIIQPFKFKIFDFQILKQIQDFITNLIRTFGTSNWMNETLQKWTVGNGQVLRTSNRIEMAENVKKWMEGQSSHESLVRQSVTSLHTNISLGQNMSMTVVIIMQIQAGVQLNPYINQYLKSEKGWVELLFGKFIAVNQFGLDLKKDVSFTKTIEVDKNLMFKQGKDDVKSLIDPHMINIKFKERNIKPTAALDMFVNRNSKNIRPFINRKGKFEVDSYEGSIQTTFNSKSQGINIVNNLFQYGGLGVIFHSWNQIIQTITQNMRLPDVQDRLKVNGLFDYWETIEDFKKSNQIWDEKDPQFQMSNDLYWDEQQFNKMEMNKLMPFSKIYLEQLVITQRNFRLYHYYIFLFRQVVVMIISQILFLLFVEMKLKVIDQFQNNNVKTDDLFNWYPEMELKYKLKYQSFKMNS